MSQGKAPFLRRVALRNYKSIRECDVALGPLMLLVGPNGSGKSNFLDALRFVAESLRTTMDQALRERGGNPGSATSIPGASDPFYRRLGDDAAER